jgi:hypothetical protein
MKKVNKMKLAGIDELLSKLDRNPTYGCQEEIHDALETLTRPEDIKIFYNALLEYRKLIYCEYEDSPVNRLMAQIAASEELGNILATYERTTKDYETIQLWRRTIPDFIMCQILDKNKK